MKGYASDFAKMLLGLSLAVSTSHAQDLQKEIADLDPHRSIRPLFDPAQTYEGLTLSQRLFPREIKRIFEDSVSKSADQSPTKRALLKVVALRAITQFQDPLIGLGDLQQLVSNITGKELSDAIIAKISWSDFDRRIKGFAPLKSEKASGDEMNHYLDSLDKEFSIEEKTALVVAIHLQYLKSMRESLPDTHSELDLGRIMELERYMEGSPDLTIRYLEVDGDYRARKEAAAQTFLWKYADRGFEAYSDVKARVFRLRSFSTFKNFQKESEIFEDLLQKQIRSEQFVRAEDFSLELVAFLTVFERLADANQISTWDWETDPDLNRIEQILKSAHGELDIGEKRWILENSQNYELAVANAKFEADRGARAFAAATKNGAWAIPIASAVMFKVWLHTRSIIQLSDRMFRDEAILIAQAVKNGAGDTQRVTELITGLSKPAAVEASSFSRHLALAMGGRDIGREAIQFIPPQPASEVVTKLPKGLNPAAQDAITAAVQQRQYIFGFASFVSKTVSKAPEAARYQNVINGLVRQIVQVGTERSLSLATRLTGGLNEISQLSSDAAKANAAIKTGASMMRTADIAIEMMPIESRLTVGAARAVLETEVNALKVSEAADLASAATRIAELHGRVMKVVSIAHYQAYLEKVAAIDAAAAEGSTAVKALARFHKMASYLAYWAGNKIAVFRTSRWLKGMELKPRSGIMGWFDSLRSVPEGAEFGATLPGVMSGSSRIINAGKTFVRNLPFIATAVGAGVYAWQVSSAYFSGDAEKEFENYQKNLKESDSKRGNDTESNAQRKMRPKNQGKIASELVTALNVSLDPLALSFNGDREQRGLPRIEIIMNVNSMAEVNLKTGFATYAYALLKVQDSQERHNGSQMQRNIESGILLQFEQKQEGEDAALAKRLRLTWAPARVYWEFKRAVILKAINPDIEVQINRAVYGTGDPSISVNISPAKADSLFGKLPALWSATNP